MSIEEKYQEQLDYLYSFIDFSLTKNLRYSEEKFNLNRMVKFMSLLGNPHRSYPVVHVAGSKGKGSTSALITSALIESGYKVGFYTSPHLHDFCERIQINHQAVSHEEFNTLVDQLRPNIAKVEGISTFELSTAMAFLYFEQQQVDFAVIEVGLGGRLDATNVVSPLVSVITSLSLDHVAVLGGTLSKIAMEKGGIIKHGRPVVVAPQKDEAKNILNEIAAERKAELIQVGRDYLYAAQSHTLVGQTFFVWPREDQALVDTYINSGGREDWEPIRLHIPLLGFHQVQNAATAYAALQVIKSTGIRIPQDKIAVGFMNVKWAGRFEILSQKPVIVVDSAHNRESALRLRHTLDDYFPGLPVVLIFGASEDKDISGMLSELLPRVKVMIATKSYHPRSVEPEQLKEIASKFGKKCIITQDIESALSAAEEIAGNEWVIIGAGSIFVAAGLREEFFKKYNQYPTQALN